VVTYFLPNPVSSSPVVDSSGVVYVGSADGSVYSFNPSTGAQNWSVSLGKPIEATLAIGQNGWLYVATRSIENIQVAGIVAAVNPVTHTVQWQVVGSDNGIGYVASPVIDQSGFVYAAVFGGIGGHEVRKFDPNVGS